MHELSTSLEESRIRVLVDVRRFPSSRRHPHFNKAALEKALVEVGIVYDWKGEDLGGRRRLVADTRHPAWKVEAFRAYADYMDTKQFRTALEGLEKEAIRSTVAIMCAETLWWKCHRRLIADALTLHGFEVIHLGAPGTPGELHRLPDMLRVDDERRPVYDVGVLPFDR